MKRVLLSDLEYPGTDGLYWLDGHPFTGIAFTLAKNQPWERAELHFRDGLRWGPTHERYAPGQPMVEATYFKGVLHGRATEWHRNGQVAEDGEYAYGITLWSKCFDERGVLEREHRMTDADVARVAELKRVYGEASPAK